MEHSVDLSAKTFVQAISPLSGGKILKKIKKALEVEINDDSGMFDIEELDMRLGSFDFDDNDDDDGKEEELLGAEVAAADSVGKALLLVKQVCTFQLLQNSLIFIASNFRFVHLLRPELFSINHASRLRYQFCSFSSGFALAGPLCIPFLTSF